MVVTAEVMVGEVQAGAMKEEEKAAAWGGVAMVVGAKVVVEMVEVRMVAAKEGGLEVAARVAVTLEGMMVVATEAVAMVVVEQEVVAMGVVGTGVEAMGVVMRVGTRVVGARVVVVMAVVMVGAAVADMVEAVVAETEMEMEAAGSAGVGAAAGMEAGATQ